ncbi:MAG: hypothetical protein PHD29_00495 [bacterium]|nr:hypothetical protein [bacterium]MDD5756204.1 hypothetical protein [bacterium]
MKASGKIWIFTGILIVFNILFFWVKPEEKILTIVSDALPVICAIVSILGIAWAVKSLHGFDQTKLAWIMLLTGIVLFMSAEAIYGYLEVILNVDVNEVFPTMADYFWMAGYIPIFTGLVMLVYGYKKSGFSFGAIKSYIVGISCFVLITALIIYKLLIPIVQDPETEILAKFVYLYYPIADLFIIIPAMILAYLTNLFGKGMISRPWRYIAVGFLCMTTFDIIYSYLSWNDMYGPGNPIDIFANLSYLLIGLGGLFQKELIESV